MNLKKNMCLIYYSYILFLTCCTSNPVLDNSTVVKTSWKINEIANDSCLMEAVTYFNDSTVLIRYNYYNCNNERVFKSTVIKGLLMQQIFYTGSDKITTSYDYTYDKNGNLSSFILYDTGTEHEIKIENIYIGNVLSKQTYYDAGNKVREIAYEYQDGMLIFKNDIEISTHIEVKTYFEQGRKTKEVKNGRVQEWIYDKNGILTEHVINPFEKKVFIYDKSQKLSRIETLRKKEDIFNVYATEEFIYYPNDSIRMKVFIEDERRKEVTKYYYNNK